VKWVDRITVADKESPCFYQRRDYKILPPDAVDSETANKYWDSTPAMLDIPINSTVSSPVSDTTVSLDATGYIEVRGYAVPHGDQGPVVRVQVSGDEGASWTDAEIEGGGKQGSKWSWVLWKARIKLQKGKQRKIFTKATDKGGNTQDEMRSTWNLRGVAYNGYKAVVGLDVVWTKQWKNNA
jgi:sulfite oxidase